MLDHFGFIVADLKKSEAFFEACLAPLGLHIIERHAYGAVIFAKSTEEAFPFIWIGIGRPSFWRQDNEPARSPVHLAFKAPDEEAVNSFYAAALKAGGSDNGKPGQRDPHYYAAYIVDPDGNNIEAGYRF